MALTIDDLGTVLNELFDIRAKWYNIGLLLNVPVGTLESIDQQHCEDSSKLRQTLMVWLKIAAQQKWQTIVEMLRSRTIGEQRLASEIEAKRCLGMLTPEGATGEVTSSDTQQRRFSWS